MVDRVDREDAYVVRYGWTVKSALLVLFAVAVTALVPFLGISMLPRILSMAFFGACGLGLSAVALCRRTTLRIDGKGVMLSGSPLFRYEATSLFVPWNEIAALVRWEQVIRPGGPKAPFDLALRVKQPYLGIKRHPGLPPLPDANTPRAINSLAVMATTEHMPLDLAHASHAVNDWTLKKDELVTILARFAPDVELKDLRGGLLSGW